MYPPIFLISTQMNTHLRVCRRPGGIVVLQQQGNNNNNTLPLRRRARTAAVAVIVSLRTREMLCVFAFIMYLFN